MTDPKTSTPNGNAEDLCITCLRNNAWNFEGCSLCPNYQKKHFAQIYAGEVGNTTYFCVAESPFLNSSAYLENHAGWQFDIEKTARNTFEKYEKEIPDIISHFTYAVRCQSERPSAKEIKACAPNLIEDLKTYSHPDHDICVFAMGATALKALGVQFSKFQDVIGKVFEIKVGDRIAHVFTGLSKKQLATKTGHLEIFDRQVQVFFDLIKKVKNHELESKRSLLAQLSENYRYPKNAREVKELVQEIITYTIQGKQAQFYPIALDTETNTLYPHRDKLQLLVVSVCWDEGRAAAIPLEHSESRIKLDDVREDLARLFNCAKPKLLANAKYDLKVLSRKGFSIENLAWDTMLGEHLISEDKKGFYGLKNITRLRLPDFAAYEDELQEIYAGRKDDDSLIPAPIEEPAHLQLLKKRRVKKVKAPPKEKKSRIEKKLAQDEGFRAVPLHQLLTYAAFDADVTWRIARQQREELTLESNTLRKAREKYRKASAPQAKRIGEVLFDHPNPPLYNMTHRILPTTRVLSEMELHGMAVDQEYTQKLKSEMDEYIRNSKPIFAAMLPVGLEDFNPASTAHVAKVLFSTGYIQPQTEEVICYAGKIEPPRTEKGAISTDAAFLKLLANSHNCTFSKTLLEYRAINKARTTFIENISVLSREDGRMHSNFHQHGTATARLCVSKNTVLNSSKGKIRIPDLKINNQSPTYIRTHTGKMRRILGVYYKGKEMMYRVGRENGEFIETTLQHKFFTPSGFKPLQGLSVSDEIIAYDGSLGEVTNRSSLKRRRLCRAVSESEINQRRTSSSEHLTQNNYEFNAVLQEQIYPRDKRAKTFSIFTSTKRKYPRKEGLSRRNNPEGNIDPVSGEGLQLGNDRQKTRSECLVCAPKHEILGRAAYRKNSLSINELRYGYINDFRPICSRHSKRSNPLLRKSTTLFRTAIYRTLTTNRAKLVYKRAVQSIRGMGAAGKDFKKSRLLELKPLRTVTIKGLTRQQYTSYTSSNSFPELFSRFWISNQKITRRNKWSISSTRRNKETRHTKTSVYQRPRVYNSHVHNPRNRKRLAYGCRKNSFHVERITYIEPIGIMDVWDIQVETDHSYIAHGFVNHNSSSEENLQNIPKRIGRAPHVYNIKRLFIPTEPKKIIVNADAKAAEVRVYAAYSKDKALIKALNEGMDPHSFFASTVYNVDNVLQGIPPGQHLEVLQAIGIDKEHAWSYEDFEARDIIKNSSKSYGEALDALRKNIKRVVFGILYGAAPKKISGIVGIPEEQAQAIIRSLFNMFPSITGYIEATKKQVQLLGTVETFLGRRRHLNLKNLPNYLKSRAERQGVNFKIQNTSAEMVLDVLCATHEPIKHEFGGHMLNTVHDSLVFQVDEQYASQMPDFIQDYGVKQVARKFPWLPVPFSWDVEIGYTYGDVMSVPAFFDKNPHAVVEDADEYLDLEIRNELAEEATIKKDAA